MSAVSTTNTEEERKLRLESKMFLQLDLHIYIGWNDILLFLSLLLVLPFF